MSIARGDGVGIEVANGVVRGIRLRHDVPDRVSHAVELPITLDDELQGLDTMLVLWAELGEPVEPTRVALFPVGSMLQRIDVTGRTGPELAALRTSLLRRRGFDSSVVVDDGPRRWLIVIGWDAALVRRIEQLVERAGFLDVSVEPSPLAFARVVPAACTVGRRVASASDGFLCVVERRVPVAAASADFTARPHPDVDLGTPSLPAPWFEDLVDAAVLDDLLARSSAAVDLAAGTIPQPARAEAAVGGTPYPPFPVHDVRAIERQIVAVGAAAASSGLAASARPVDMIAGADPADRFDRPWVWERVSALPEVEPSTGPTTIQRAGARFLPRRRTRGEK
ncbi:MAG: hypothetical protein AAFP84_10690 [Actinomycetota bacterium]